MLINDLTDLERDAVIVALKYWRSNRGTNDVRRTDAVLSREGLDVLIAKLQIANLPLPPALEDFPSRPYLR